jgi:hypothetical protein
MARPERFELPTPRFVVWCSIQLSYGRARARRGRLAVFASPGKRKVLGARGGAVGASRHRAESPGVMDARRRRGDPRGDDLRLTALGLLRRRRLLATTEPSLEERAWPPRRSEKPTFSCQTGRAVVYCSNNRRNADGLRRKGEFFGDSQGDPNSPWRQLQASSRQDGVRAIRGPCLAVAFFRRISL